MNLQVASRTDPVNVRVGYRNSAGAGHTARTFWAATVVAHLPMKSTKGDNSLLGSVSTQPKP